MAPVGSARSGVFQRSVSQFGTAVDPGKAHADFEHGVLTLSLPKAESSKPRQIKVGGGPAPQVSQGNGSK